MEQQDYLKKQIDQMGLVLARLLGDILGLKSQGKGSECVILAENTMKSELDIGLTEFSEIPGDQLIETLKPVLGDDNGNLNKFADILVQIAEIQQDNSMKLKFIEQVIEIDKYLETNNKTLNFDRYLKIMEIKNGISI